MIKLKNNPVKLKDSIFMFQKELGNKISGKFPSKLWPFTIFTNYKTKILRKFAEFLIVFFKTKSRINGDTFWVQKIYLKLKMENLEKLQIFYFQIKEKWLIKILKIIDKNIKRLKDLKLNMRPSDIKI